MKRLVQPELLDYLSPADPQAARSRRDLRRVNAWMGNHSLMAATLQKEFQSFPSERPPHLTELGAGDGHFLLRVAQKLAPPWPATKATLIDLQKNVSPETLAAFKILNWHASASVINVFAWPQTESDVVIANLFLHHFETAQLADLLQIISQRTKLFIAIEPLRAPWPLFCSRWLWAIGCNAVTRHDATVSVRAGFTGNELSALWSQPAGWQITEQPAGPFSHLFIARKTD